MKTIKVTEKIWKKLMVMKLKKGFNSMSDLLIAMIVLINKNKLDNELK